MKLHAHLSPSHGWTIRDEDNHNQRLATDLREEDAQLIVRAVNRIEELIEALEVLLEPCPPGTHEIGPDGICPTCPVEIKARAALAKARGEA